MDVNELLQIPPFSDEIPSHPVGRIKAFVRDLAYGVIAGHWDVIFRFLVGNSGTGFKWTLTDGSLRSDEEFYVLDNFVMEKWGKNPPNPAVLASMGYLTSKEPIVSDSDVPQCYLTQKAYDLVDEVPQSPIFISYSRSNSSAFALLILARMKAVGMNPFLDITGLVGGDYWHARLDEEIENSTHLLCLVGQTTLDSQYVRREIRLANEHGLMIIPVLHNGMKPSDLDDILHVEEVEILKSRQIITVVDESSEEYNRAIIRILNIFGVTP